MNRLQYWDGEESQDSIADGIFEIMESRGWRDIQVTFDEQSVEGYGRGRNPDNSFRFVWNEYLCRYTYGGNVFSFEELKTIQRVFNSKA